MVGKEEPNPEPRTNRLDFQKVKWLNKPLQDQEWTVVSSTFTASSTLSVTVAPSPTPADPPCSDCGCAYQSHLDDYGDDVHCYECDNCEEYYDGEDGEAIGPLDEEPPF